MNAAIQPALLQREYFRDRSRVGGGVGNVVERVAIRTHTHTHQPQVASKADRHILIEKLIKRDRTTIAVRELNAANRIEEIARMLAGEKITDAARENARELIAAAG